MVECYGRDPRSEAGRCYQALPWSWAALVQLVGLAQLRSGNKLVPAEAMELLNSCNGFVLETQDQCDRLARALTFLLEHPCALREHGLQLIDDHGEATISVPAEDAGLMVAPNGQVYASGSVSESAIQALSLRSAIQLKLRDAQAFCRFLLSCNGFAVLA